MGGQSGADLDERHLADLPCGNDALVGMHGDGDDVVRVHGIELLRMAVFVIDDPDGRHHINNVALGSVEEVVTAVVAAVPVGMLELQAVVRRLVCVHRLAPVGSLGLAAPVLVAIQRRQIDLRVARLVFEAARLKRHRLLARDHPLRLDLHDACLVHCHLRLTPPESRHKLILNVRILLVVVIQTGLRLLRHLVFVVGQHLVQLHQLARRQVAPLNDGSVHQP